MSRLTRLRELNRQRPARISGSELVAMSLVSLGFEWVAGVGGTPVYGIFQACAEHGLRVFGTRSQAGATLMAAASAWVGGRPSGAVVVSAGPAVTNAITGLLVARDNGWPLLVLGGRRAVHDGQHGAFQELDGAGLIRPIVKWAACAQQAASLPALLKEAVRVACSGRPGPVYLDLPEDVLAAMAPDPGPIAPLPPEFSEACPADLDRVAHRLQAARRPVLVLGDGVRWRIDPAQLRSHLERSGLGVIALPLLRGILPETHPFQEDAVQRRGRLLAEADDVVLFGTGLDWRLRFGAEIHPAARVVQIGESPSQPPGWGERLEVITAEPGLFLHRLLEQLSVGPALAGSPWNVETAALSPPANADAALWDQPRDQRLTIPSLFALVRSVLPPAAFLVLDGNLTLQAGQRELPCAHAFHHLDPGWNGCMGSGIPLALAARLHHPASPVLLITGDFAFGLGAIELETAVRHALPIVVLIINNGGPNGGLHQRLHLPVNCPELVHAFPAELPYEKVAAGLGMKGCSVSTTAELGAALGSALDTPGSFLINAVVDMNPDNLGLA